MRPLDDQHTWVYQLRDTDGYLLYVGIAVDIERRMSQHASAKDWWESVAFIDCDRYATRIQAREIESHLILTKSPVYNIQGIPAEPVHQNIGRRSYIHPPSQAMVLQGVQRDWR